MRPPIWSEGADSGISAVTWCNWWKASGGARHWRRELGEKAQRPGADLDVLLNAGQQLKDAGL